MLNALLGMMLAIVPLKWLLLLAAAGLAVALTLRLFKISWGMAFLAGTLVFLVPLFFLPIQTQVVKIDMPRR